MPGISKTGLLPSLPSPKKNPKQHIHVTTFSVPKFCGPAPYVIRPFAGVYNPFPYGCSVLCNHPADYEAKDVVKKAKESWAHDGRAMVSSDGNPRTSHRPSRSDEPLAGVPEELFRKYTETDSRPITPAPTVASVVTRSSQARRCVTPDAVCSQQGQERTLLVLDLRRSHSQETLNWLGNTIPATALQAPSQTPSRSPSSVGASSPPVSKKKKSGKGKLSASSSLQPDNQEADNEASQKLKQQVLNVKTLGVNEGDPHTAMTDRTAGSSGGDGEVVKRRGKKKKGKRGGGDGREGEKEFQGIQDPGETQVSTLGESRCGSTRPSLTTGFIVEPSEPVPPSNTTPGVTSFLPINVLKQLQRQLDQETVESEFDEKRRIALEEALRTRLPAKQRVISEELKGIKKELSIAENNAQKWLSVPRVFSRKSSRFELPMDGNKIIGMNCLEYASQCVFPSKERLALYNQVFNLYREELDEDEQVERTLLGKNILQCLNGVMGRPLTEPEGLKMIGMLGITPTATLDFRTFAGVAAVCERLLGSPPPRTEDPPHTLEQADFRSLDRLLAPLPIDSPLADLIKLIKQS